MNYKKIIKSRSTREKILTLLSWIPDKTMLKIQYRIKSGRKLNLKNPKRFTEKLQYYKLYYRDPLMIKCVDKYDVREYIKECGYENTLNECYGIYNSADEIDFSTLPNSFVIKDTLGGGGNSVVICKDKSRLNIDELKGKLNGWTNRKLVRNGGREWPYYSGKKNRILIEKYLDNGSNNLIEYKFFCFHGRVECLYVLSDRKLGESVKISIYDRDFAKLPVKREGHDDVENNIDCPPNFNNMIHFAEKISQPFPHVRVDIYNINNNIVFGETTFFNASGYFAFNPDEFDFELGEVFDIRSIN